MNREYRKKLRLLEPAIYILQNPDSSWMKNPEERALMTLSNNDCEFIPRVENAGKTVHEKGHDLQIMHNGLKVIRDGYQGSWESKVIEGLNGIHEPQEEKVFYEVLKLLTPGATMLELGSWWSYYSMWFLKQIKNSKAYCTEPDPENLVLGKSNARINGFKENKDIFFRQYASGLQNGKRIKFTTESGEKVNVPIRTIDSMINEENIKKIDILHFDIQGAEYETLLGAREAIEKKKIRFIFISTHHYSISSNPVIHQECLDFLKKNGAHIVAEHTIHESSSGDGLIVASFDKKDIKFKVKITPQPSNDAMYRLPDNDVDILWHSYNNLLNMYKVKLNELEKKELEIQKKELEIQKKEKIIQEKNTYINEITPLKKHLKRQVQIRLDRKNNAQ